MSTRKDNDDLDGLEVSDPGDLPTNIRRKTPEPVRSTSTSKELDELMEDFAVEPEKTPPPQKNIESTPRPMEARPTPQRPPKVEGIREKPSSSLKPVLLVCGIFLGWVLFDSFVRKPPMHSVHVSPQELAQLIESIQNRDALSARKILDMLRARARSDRDWDSLEQLIENLDDTESVRTKP